MPYNKPTEAQKNALRKFSISEDLIEKMTFADASVQLDNLIRKAKERKSNSTNPINTTTDKTTTPADQSRGNHMSPNTHEANEGALRDDEIEKIIARRITKARQIVANGFNISPDAISVDNELVAVVTQQLYGELSQRRIHKDTIRKYEMIT